MRNIIIGRDALTSLSFPHCMAFNFQEDCEEMKRHVAAIAERDSAIEQGCREYAKQNGTPQPSHKVIMVALVVAPSGPSTKPPKSRFRAYFYFTQLRHRVV